MEVPQGNSLYSYLKQPKMSFFSSSFLVQNQSTGGGTDLAVGGLVQWEEGGGEMVKEGDYGANTVYICM
jgi:hypothetical protein